MIVKRLRRSTPPNGGQLRVGNLPYHITATELTQLFGGADAVQSVEIVRYPETGYPKGIALVVMATVDATTAAIHRIDGLTYAGRDLTVEHVHR